MEDKITWTATIAFADNPINIEIKFKPKYYGTGIKTGICFDEMRSLDYIESNIMEYLENCRENMILPTREDVIDLTKSLINRMKYTDYTIQ